MWRQRTNPEPEWPETQRLSPLFPAVAAAPWVGTQFRRRWAHRDCEGAVVLVVNVRFRVESIVVGIVGRSGRKIVPRYTGIRPRWVRRWPWRARTPVFGLLGRRSLAGTQKTPGKKSRKSCPSERVRARRITSVSGRPLGRGPLRFPEASGRCPKQPPPKNGEGSRGPPAGGPV